MIDPVTVGVFVAFFALVAVVGFLASRRSQAGAGGLHEWGLGGRRFGTVITWFLLGGDLYTAYTFIAVPGLMFGAGAIGFFAAPYTTFVFPLALAFLPRLWTVCHRRRYVTAADFVHGRYGSRALELAVALTGILAVMPYIALQLVGIQVVVAAMGIGGAGPLANLPLIIAFAVVAAYTYAGGLRASAMIALVKDVMIYFTVIAAVVVIPIKLGGFAHIFAAAAAALAAKPKPGVFVTTQAGFGAYWSLALGSAMALFLYPHIVTGVLSSRRVDAIRRNMALLPAYSVLLIFIALLGYMALAAGITPKTPNFAVPMLFQAMFPNWFAGFGFAAIAIGALVPAAIMAIAAGNLVTRNIYTRYVNSAASDADQSRLAKIVSLAVKLGALAFAIWLPTQYAINLQLLGGIWILQTFPAIVGGLFGRWFHERALLAGWFAGMIAGTLMAASQNFSPVFPLRAGGATVALYAGIDALVLNVAAAALLTLLCDALGMTRGPDSTSAGDYGAVGAGA